MNLLGFMQSRNYDESSIYAAHPKYLQSARWKRIRPRRLWWDGYKCRTCHATYKLEVHHASYRWFNRWGELGEWFEMFDAITLCKRCHGGVHGAQRIKEFRD